MKFKIILIAALLCLSGFLFAQRPTPVGGAGTNNGVTDTIVPPTKTAMWAGYGNPIRWRHTPPDTGMVVVAVPSNTAGRAPLAYWEYISNVRGLGATLTQADRDNIAASIQPDETRLIQDSILVYRQNGAEIGRDTITGTGGDNAVAYTAGDNINLVGNEFSAEVGQLEVDAARNAAQTYADLRANEARQAAIDTAAAIREDILPQAIDRTAAFRFAGINIAEQVTNAAQFANDKEGIVFIEGQNADISTFPRQTHENAVLVSDNPEAINTGANHPDIYRVHNTRSAKATGLPLFQLKPEKLNTFLSSSSKKVVVMSTSLGTQAVGTSPLDNFTSKIAMQLSAIYGDIDFQRRSIGATNASMFDDPVGPSGGPGSFDPNSDQYAWAETDKLWIQHVEDDQPDLLFLGWNMNDDGTLATHDAYRKIIDTVLTWSKVPSIVFVTDAPPTLANNFSGSPDQLSVNESAAYLRAYAQVNENVAGVIDANRIGMMKTQGVDPASPVYNAQPVSLPDGASTLMPSPAKDWEMTFFADWSATDKVNRYIRIRLGGQNADELQIRANRGSNTRTITLQTQTFNYSVDFESDAKDSRAEGIWKVQANFPYLFVEFDGDIMFEGLIGVPAEHGWHTPTLLSNVVGGYTFTGINWRPAKGADYIPSLSYSQAFGEPDGSANQPKGPFGGNGVNHFSSLAYSEIYQVAVNRTLWPVGGNTVVNNDNTTINGQSFQANAISGPATRNFPIDENEAYLQTNTGGGAITINMTSPSLIPASSAGLARVIHCINGNPTTINANGNTLIVDASNTASTTLVNGERLICYAVGGVWRCNQQNNTPKQSTNAATNTTFPNYSNKDIIALHYVNPSSTDTITIPAANGLSGDERGQTYTINLVNGNSVVLKSESNTIYMPPGVGNVSSGNSKFIQIAGTQIRLTSRGDLWEVDFSPRIGIAGAVGPVDMNGNTIDELPNATQNDQPATYGQLVSSTGGAGAMNKGLSTANNTDANGDITITHGLSATPGQVLLTLNQTEAYRLAYHDANGTTFKVRVTDTNGAIVANTNVRFAWLAYQ